MAAAYLVGIDLGTSHTVVASAPVAAARADSGADAITLFAIDQLVAPGEVAARPLLPSLRYHPAPGELAAGELALPWGPPADGAVIGELARRLGAQVPGRLVASAKSWLSHPSVDRLATILPWGAPDEVPKVSPVAASAGTLAHVRAAWNQRHPQAPLERQEIVLTVPASFDDAARTLTVQAAREAGLPALRLLEEPQAALYDWLFRHRATLAADLAGTRLVLVCDVGGGTTDLSLVRVVADGATPAFERVAVGQHLMLGGDNMDLAIAHLAEARLGGGGGAPRLAAGALGQLVERCRGAKERLLAADAPERATVTLLGGGARLVGGARTAELTRDEVRRAVVDGFFPPGAADDGPRRPRAGSGLVAYGLPYASDPAITRHVAAFLQRHAAAGAPDALLLNGGVFRADAIVQRLHEVLAGWRGGPLATLHNPDPDVAVARGAVAYVLARRGLAPRIGGGSPRSYFLRLADDTAGAGRRGICVLPRGTDEGRELPLEGRSFALTRGQPVRFELAASTAGDARAGDLVDLDALQAQPLPPLVTVLRDGDGDGGAPGRREVAVRLVSALTEVGTLALHCIAADDPARRWALEFRLRDEPGRAAGGGGLPPRFDDAVVLIDKVFGARDRQADPKAVKQLRARLEALLGPRERWPLPLLRALADALLQRASGRRRSADHERRWLSFTGWCLRPGFGDPLDGWRCEQLWRLFEPGVQHGQDAQVCAEWWTLWRRVAGGLDEAAQQRLLQDFAFNLRSDEIDDGERPPRPPRLVRGGWDDMLRLGASLERIANDHKAEIGDWLVEQLRQPAGPTPRGPWTAWAIGRLGARVPFQGNAHRVVPTEVALRWLDALLALDGPAHDGVPAAVANLARLSGDRARDLPPAARERAIAFLEASQAPAGWIARVREFEALDAAGESTVFGEALPPGLKLIG